RTGFRPVRTCRKSESELRHGTGSPGQRTQGRKPSGLRLSQGRLSIRVEARQSCRVFLYVLDTPEKRVRPAFVADPPARPVAAEKSDVVAKRQDLVPDGGEQGRMIAARQIRTADRTAEQHVSHMRKALFLAEVDHVPRRV